MSGKKSPVIRTGAWFLALLSVFSVLFFSGCAGTKCYRGESFSFFDTYCSYTFYTDSRNMDAAFAGLLWRELSEAHARFDGYCDHDVPGNIRDLNRSAGKETVSPDPEVEKLIRFGQELSGKTNGKCDITLGALTALWHDFREEQAPLPERDEILEALAHTGMRSLLVEENTVSFLDPELQLDVGAIAKGYAAERAREALLAVGYTGFLLNIGGMTLVAGEKPDGTPWRVGIESPDGGGYLCVMTLADGDAVSTSGSYQRYRDYEGVRYHHIIDPVTGYPVTEWESVTVVTRDAGIADALSTALFCLPLAEGKSLLASSFPGAEACWFDGEHIYYTDGFPVSGDR